MDRIDWIEGLIEDGAFSLASESHLVELLAALREFSEMAKFDFDRAVHRSGEEAEENAGWQHGGAAYSSKYSGWDRIHDDNKAEGRPTGDQWNDEGVDYSLGFKVRR